MRIILCAVCAVLVLSFTACGRGDEPRGEGTLIFSAEQGQTESPPLGEPPSDAPDVNGTEPEYTPLPADNDNDTAGANGYTENDNGTADANNYTENDNYEAAPPLPTPDPQASAHPHSWSVGTHSAGFLRVFSAYYRGEGAQVFLTFELTYEAGYTFDVLDTLHAQGVRAAFFLTLPYIYNNADVVERMMTDGHVIGLRSHAPMTEMNDDEMGDMLLRYDFRELFGQPIDPFLRPAYGAFDEHTLQMARHYGYFTIFWSVWHTHWAYAADLAHDGMVLSLAGMSAANAAALDTLINGIRAAGYTFATLYELI